MKALAKDGHTLEYIKDQYRHCKSILVPDASAPLLERCGIPSLAAGAADSGLIGNPKGKAAAELRAFIKAIGRHRHPERDRDPALV